MKRVCIVNWKDDVQNLISEIPEIDQSILISIFDSQSGFDIDKLMTNFIYLTNKIVKYPTLKMDHKLKMKDHKKSNLITARKSIKITWYFPCRSILAQSEALENRFFLLSCLNLCAHFKYIEKICQTTFIIGVTKSFFRLLLMLVCSLWFSFD